MQSTHSCQKVSGKPAFSLIEMALVIAVLLVLMVAGIRLLDGHSAQSRRLATDLLEGMIDQARVTAMTSRSCVVLALLEPGDLAGGDERCRLGLFKVDTLPDAATDRVSGVMLSRWRAMESGIALIGGDVDGVENPMDAPPLTISYGFPRPQSVKVHAIAFNVWGGLDYPAGSTPVAMRIAEGACRNGTSYAVSRGKSDRVAESRIKIGRVIARPYRVDG